LNDFVIHSEAVAATEETVNFVDAGFGSAIQETRAQGLRVFAKGHRNVAKKSVETVVDRLSKLLFAPPATKLTSVDHERSVTTVVRTITLDSLVAKIGQNVDLLQMDVQGAELDVLRGGMETLQKGRVKRLLIGTHGEKIHRACISRLRRYGYSIEFEQQKSKEQPDGILFASERS
jgi:FkbM family methyltransferase